MRRVFEEPPSTVLVEGASYRINTDFKTWIAVGELLQDEALSNADKIICVLMLCYIEKLPKNLISAFDALMAFYSGFNSYSGKKTGDRVIDFRMDEGAIYAAFLQDYNIDLYSLKLHWWKFIKLLNSLSEDTEFMKIVAYRCSQPDKIKNKEQRNFIRKMKNRYRIKKAISDSDISKALIGDT